MINKIIVDGFKSLIDFHMELRSGLNVLVGPNGSGKTNIIAFFEFLRFLQEMNASNAISTAGGAGTILAKQGEDLYRRNLAVQIFGSIELTTSDTLNYHYAFQIDMLPSAERITYRQQRLKFKIKPGAARPSMRITKPDLDIEMTLSSNLDPQIKIRALNHKKLKSRHHFLRQAKGKKALDNATIKEFLDQAADPDYSLVPSLRFVFDEAFGISIDLRGGPVFNIEPSKARRREDSAKPPGIQKDGSGLYATLYAMKQNEERGRSSRQVYFYERDHTNIGDAKITDVLKYIRLANNSIKNIDVLNNPFDNQLQARVSVAGESGDTILPLSAMSDGTIKWIALVTIIATTRSVFSIEEPENYLHPLMQSEILSIMRSSAKSPSSILMSTHSETLLNSAKPEEIIVVSFVNGKTIVRRPENVEVLRQEIRETCFGLGYYYLSGSLEE